jgi:hypothetical protein
MGANFNSQQSNGQTIPPGMVWSETQGKLVNQGPNSGAMPSFSNGGLPSSNNTQPFGSPYNPQDPWAQAAYAGSMGNLYGAQTATAANRVNQNTPYGSLNYQQTGTDAQGNPIWAANQTLNPQLQSAVDSSLGGLSSYNQGFQGQAFNPNSLQNPQANLPSYGINPGQTYSDAIMQRLQPSLDRQTQASDAQLANQGIMPGSEAYKTAKTLLGQTQNDALTSAIVGGMQTGLAANQQQYGQNLGTNTQNMAAQQQQYGQQYQNYGLPLSVATGIKGLTQQNYVNPYSQAAVAGPDYLGAAGLSNQNALGNQNAATANRAGMTSGLFNLGAAALTNPYVMKQAGSGLSNLYDWATA